MGDAASRPCLCTSGAKIWKQELKVSDSMPQNAKSSHKHHSNDVRNSQARAAGPSHFHHLWLHKGAANSCMQRMTHDRLLSASIETTLAHTRTIKLQ